MINNIIKNLDPNKKDIIYLVELAFFWGGHPNRKKAYELLSYIINDIDHQYIDLIYKAFFYGKIETIKILILILICSLIGVFVFFYFICNFFN
jgi:hypothetical protein